MSEDSNATATPTLQILQDLSSHNFIEPLKKINEGQDVSHFLQSRAYSDIMTFLLQLNRAMFATGSSGVGAIQTWPMRSPNFSFSSSICQLQSLLKTLKDLTTEAPPDPGPRRFGNMAFRKWYQALSDRTPTLLSQHLPTLPQEAHTEISSYFLGSFGSAQRLDYGSGHELSFLAFLGSIWKLNGFPTTRDPFEESRGIVLGIMQPYLELIRHLIKTYTLEPAGSHGVWGLDDHSFIPYILGSAQYGPPITPDAQTPTEGSLENAPNPGDVAQAAKSARHKDTNMYFSAISFIHDVKKGPFWEHSPMLYDISGVRGGWGKINKGMIKMYNAEVLSKFPVVQHFRFGALFSWERDPEAPEVPASVHTANQPAREGMGGSSTVDKAAARGHTNAQEGVRAPWATGSTSIPTTAGSGEGTKAPWAGGGRPMPVAGRSVPSTRFPGPGPGLRNPMAEESRAMNVGGMLPPTRAPWAKPP